VKNTLYRLAILGVSLSTMSCGSPAKPQGESPCQMGKCVTDASSPTDAASCEDLTLRALAVLMGAATSVAQCTVSSDCKVIAIPADCLSSCITVVGNDDVRNAIASNAAALGDICRQFHQNGCTVSEGGCPALSNSYACQMSQCTQP
jgi:hypothetical protein